VSIFDRHYTNTHLRLHLRRHYK